MKKQYIEPELKVFCITTSEIIAGSPGIGYGDTPGDPEIDNDAPRRRQSDWSDYER